MSKYNLFLSAFDLLLLFYFVITAMSVSFFVGKLRIVISMFVYLVLLVFHNATVTGNICLMYSKKILNTIA